MKQERREWIEAVQMLEGDLPGQVRALKAIEDSDAWVHGKPVAFSYVPNLFNAQDMAFLQDTCTMTHRILTKVIERFIEDPSYREIFHFPPEAERLILLPCGYEEKLPMGRFDIFLDEDDKSFKFCEFNTDGSGAMSRDHLVSRALMETDSFKRFARTHKVEPFELFDSWVEAFMGIFKTDPCYVENPTVCVTDFRESGVFSDFNRFIEAFQRAGVNARFVDVRSFSFDGEHLIDPSDGTVINAIYRRSVTSEILQHPGECDAMIDAVAAGKVCLIGHFRTTVVHSKMVNVALFDPRTRAFLTDEEWAFVQAHVPVTYRLRHDTAELDISAVKADKDAWIIKPEDDYGASGVYPGVDFSQDEWERLVDENMDNAYIAQEFYPPRKVNVILPGRGTEMESWQQMPGFYQYCGKICGFYVRLGREGVIALDHGGIIANSYKVDC